MPDNPTRRAVAILCCLLYLTACSIICSQDQGSKTYPEQGRVIAKTVSAKATASRAPVFRVETDMRVYEFERKDSELVVGGTIQFRIENNWAYVQHSSKEQKLRVIDTQLKDDD